MYALGTTNSYAPRHAKVILIQTQDRNRTGSFSKIYCPVRLVGLSTQIFVKIENINCPVRYVLPNAAVCTYPTHLMYDVTSIEFAASRSERLLLASVSRFEFFDLTKVGKQKPTN